MKSKFTAAIAVIVVALMIGSAFMPLMSDNSTEYTSAATSDNNKYTNEGGSTLEDLLGMISSGSSDDADVSAALESLLSEYMTTELAEKFLGYEASKMSSSELSLLGGTTSGTSLVDLSKLSSRDISLYSGTTSGTSLVDLSKLSEIVSELDDASDVTIDTSKLSDITSVLSGLFGSDTAGVSTTGLDSYKSFVPVDRGDTPYEGMTEWDGTTTTEGQVVGLYNGATANLDYTVSTGTIKSSSTLVLFPLGYDGATNYNFTINSPTGAGIYMETGSYLDILGMRFKVVGHEGDDVNVVSVKGTATVESTASAASGFDATLSLGAGSHISFPTLFKYYFTAEEESNVISVSSDSMSTEAGKTVLTNVSVTSSDKCKVKYASESEYIYDFTLSGTTDTLKFKATPGTDSTKGTVDIEFDPVTYSYLVSDTVEGVTEIIEQIDTLKIPAGSLIVTAIGDINRTTNIGNGIELTFATEKTVTAETIAVEDVAISGLELTMSSFEIFTQNDMINDAKNAKFSIPGDAELKCDAISIYMDKTDSDEVVFSATVTISNVTSCSLNDFLYSYDYSTNNKITEVSCDSFDSYADSIEFKVLTGTPKLKLVFTEPTLNMTTEGISFNYVETKESGTTTKVATVNGGFTFGADVSFEITDSDIKGTVSDASLNVLVDNVEVTWIKTTSSVADSLIQTPDKITGKASIGLSAGSVSVTTAAETPVTIATADSASILIAADVNYDTGSETDTKSTAGITLKVENLDFKYDSAISVFGASLTNTEVKGLDVLIDLQADLNMPGTKSTSEPALTIQIKDSYIEMDSLYTRPSLSTGDASTYYEIDLKGLSIKMNLAVGGTISTSLSSITLTALGGSASIGLTSLAVNTVSEGTETKTTTTMVGVKNFSIAVSDLMYLESKWVEEVKSGDEVIKTTTTDKTQLKGKLSAGFEDLNVLSDLLASYVPGLSFENLDLKIAGVEVEIVMTDTKVVEKDKDDVNTSAFDVNTAKIGEFTVSADKIGYDATVTAAIEGAKISITNVDVAAHQVATIQSTTITVTANAELSIGVNKANVIYGAYDIRLDPTTIGLAVKDLNVTFVEAGQKSSTSMPTELSGTVTLTVKSDGINVIDEKEGSGEQIIEHSLVSIDKIDLSVSVAIVYDGAGTEPVVVTVTVNFTVTGLSADLSKQSPITIPISGLGDITLKNIIVEDADMSVNDLKIVVNYPIPETGDAEAQQNATVEVTLYSMSFIVEKISGMYPQTQYADAATESGYLLTIEEFGFTEVDSSAKVEFTIDYETFNVNVIREDVKSSGIFVIGLLNVEQCVAGQEEKITLASVEDFEITMVNAVESVAETETQISEIYDVTASVEIEKFQISVGKIEVMAGIADIESLVFAIEKFEISADGTYTESKPPAGVGDDSSINVSKFSLKGGISLSAKTFDIDTTALAAIISEVPIVAFDVKDFAFSVSDVDVSYEKTSASVEQTITETETFKAKLKINFAFNDLNVAKPELPADVKNIDLAIKDLALDVTVSKENSMESAVIGLEDIKSLKVTLASLMLNVDGASYKTGDTTISLEDTTLTISDVSFSLGWMDVTGNEESSEETQVCYLEAGISVALDAKTVTAEKDKVGEEGTELFASLKDAKFRVTGVSGTVVLGTVISTTVDVATISADATVYYKPVLKEYSPAVSIAVNGLTWNVTGIPSLNNLGIFEADSIAADATIRYDGLDRSLDLDASDVKFTPKDTSVAAVSAPPMKLEVKDKLTVSCDIPFKTMGLTETLYVDANLDIVAEAKNLVFDYKYTDSSKETFTADSVSVTSRTPIETAPYVEEISVVISGNVNADSTYISADSVSGYLKNYNESNQPFTVSNSPKFSFTNSMSDVGMGIVIEKGDAVFAAGYMPLALTVGKDATFSANGLSANSFVFKDASKATGTVSMRMAENTALTKRVIVMSDTTVLALTEYNAGKTLCPDGYKLSFDLATKSGTFTAENGTEIPVWESKYGNTEWVRAEDHKTATFTALANGSNYSFETVPLTYYFSYSDSTAVEKKYGESITLAEVPAKEGYKAVGWSDGSGTTYAAGKAYVMPARNVTLTPVYANDAPVVEKTEKDVAVKAVEDTSTIAKASDINDVKDNGNLSIAVKGAVVEMPKSTVDGLKAEYATTEPTKDLNLILTVTKVTEIDDEVKKVFVADNHLYSIELKPEDGSTDFTYSNNQVFKVTITIASDKPIEDFSISYLGTTGGAHAVGLLGFTDNGDGTYDVTFECNHFSEYMIEPTYKDVPAEQELNLALIIALTIVTLMSLYIIVAQVRKH